MLINYSWTAKTEHACDAVAAITIAKHKNHQFFKQSSGYYDVAFVAVNVFS